MQLRTKDSIRRRDYLQWDRTLQRSCASRMVRAWEFVTGWRRDFYIEPGSGQFSSKAAYVPGGGGGVMVHGATLGSASGGLLLATCGSVHWHPLWG